MKKLHIGIDFDNTIINYGTLFHTVAVERGLISPSVPQTKFAVREYLRQVGREDDWTELQGIIYGPQIRRAYPYPQVQEFFTFCNRHAISLSIISHKTRFPYLGEPHDLHESARQWLDQQGFFSSPDFGIARERTFFAQTKEEKLQRIATEECSHFIDDLPELLTDPRFPQQVKKILFVPAEKMPEMPEIVQFDNWISIRTFFHEFYSNT